MKVAKAEKIIRIDIWLNPKYQYKWVISREDSQIENNLQRLVRRDVGVKSEVGQPKVEILW